MFKKNRPDRRGGGVAILVHNSIQKIPLRLRDLDTFEAVGVSLVLPEVGLIDILSIYSPRGNSSSEDLTFLFNHQNQLLIGGDLSSQHPS